MIRRRSIGAQSRSPPLSNSKKRTKCGNRNDYTAVAKRCRIACSIFFAVLCCTVVLYMSIKPATPSVIKTKSRLGSRNGRERHEREAHLIKYANLIEIQTSSHRYDVIVVGCGPAGITAALFASRMGMSVLVVGSPSAGSLSGTERFDNFPSFFGSDNGGGQGWIDASLEQASFYGAEFAPPTFQATGIVRPTAEQNASIEVHLSEGTSTKSSASETKILGKSLIIASGSVPRKLDLPHEGSLWGHSLHNCALCDGDAYVHDRSKKSVAVIGGGDAAVEAIFLLHKLGMGAIHWIHRRDGYRASPIEVEKIRQLPNVEVWTPFVVIEWMVKGKDGAVTDDIAPLEMEGIRVAGASNGHADPDATSSLVIPCDGAFLMIGSTPNSEWLAASGIDLDPISKLIRLTPFSDGSAVNNPIPTFSTSTSIQGVFAAGEVADDTYRQALTASSEGAKAAIDAQRYLRFIGPSPSKDQRNDTQQQRQVIEHDQLEQDEAVPVDCDLTTADCILHVVSTNPVVVFSKYFCPHCRRALEVLNSFSARTGFIEPLVLDLASIDGMKTQEQLAIMTGRRTVPNVFVGGKSIGGGDETVHLQRAGTLGELLRKAGAFQ
jgi:thioredoxin reductase/glutaredoxin